MNRHGLVNRPISLDLGNSIKKLFYLNKVEQVYVYLQSISNDILVGLREFIHVPHRYILIG